VRTIKELEIPKSIKLKELRIKGDIKMSYDRNDIHFLYTTNNKEEYRHLMDAYDITEEYLKKILLDLKQPLTKSSEAENGV
jgi:hypothetical protein